MDTYVHAWKKVSMKYSTPANKAAFNQSVWDIVRQVPSGKVTTYGYIAGLIPPPPGMSMDNYRAWGSRWVGGAMAACPEDVPWWRVINSQGKVSLRQGQGGTRQRDILESEGVVFSEREQVNLKEYSWSGPDSAQQFQQAKFPDISAEGDS